MNKQTNEKPKFVTKKQKFQSWLFHFWTRAMAFFMMTMISFGVTITVSTSVVPLIAPSLSKAVGISYQSPWLDVVILFILPLVFIYAMVFVLLLVLFKSLWIYFVNQANQANVKFDEHLLKK